MKKLILLFPLVFCLSSCWDYEEPSAQNYVLGVGVDYVNDEFVLSAETVKITGDPTSLSASEGVIIEGSGQTLYDALIATTLKAGKRLYWGHTEVILLSESVAREHLTEICDLISRSYEIYSNVNLSVVKDASPREILTAKTPQSGMVSTHIANIFENEKTNHRFVCCELWQFKRNFPYTLIPLIKLSDYPRADGSAVFHNMEFIGYLTGNETQIFSLVETSASGLALPNITIDGITLLTEVADLKKDKQNLDIAISILNASAPFDLVNIKNRKRVEEKLAAIILEQISLLTTKPFGNPLSYDSYEISITLKNSGLIKQ